MKDCSKCRFKERRKDIFPCDKCKEKGYKPITCYDCRYGSFELCKKGIRPCKKFEWN